METTKKSSRKASGASADKIQSAYVEYVLTNGKQPASVYKFCLDLGIKEEAFYQFFGSFESIDRHIWTQMADKTIARLTADKEFNIFSSRDKILSFYYSLLEQLKSNRSFAIHQLGQFPKPELTPSYLKGFKQSFTAFVESVFNHGKANGEIANRPYIEKTYPQLLWMHLGFILLFWKEDDSPGFEKTDAAVEKSVNLAFDLIGKGAVDTALDFAKFLYQARK